jgi:hypothetical protein
VASLLLEIFLEMLQEVVVEVLTTQVSVTSGSLYSEDTTSDVKERDIESSSTQIENENVLLLGGFGVETVGNSSCGRFVNDTENLETSDGTSILGSQTLRVVEVSGDTVNNEYA